MIRRAFKILHTVCRTFNFTTWIGCVNCEENFLVCNLDGCLAFWIDWILALLLSQFDSHCQIPLSGSRHFKEKLHFHSPAKLLLVSLTFFTKFSTPFFFDRVKYTFNLLYCFFCMSLRINFSTCKCAYIVKIIWLSENLKKWDLH